MGTLSGEPGQKWTPINFSKRKKSTGFPPLVTSLIFPVFFQAVGSSGESALLTIIRTVVLFVPLGWLFSRIGLAEFWITFPVTEVITSTVGYLFYRRFRAKYNCQRSTFGIE